MDKQSASAPADVDVVIIGGGLTGLATAAALVSGGVETALLERRPLGETRAATFDGRVTAVAYGSQQFLQRIGVWAGVEPTAEPIIDIIVEEPGTPGRVHYDHRDIGSDPLGWIAENRHLRASLIDRLEGDPSVSMVAPVEITSLDRDVTRVLIETDRGMIRARLVIAADGKFSGVRDEAAIAFRDWRYHQTGIVCTLKHERPHHGRATERFYPDGPFALLPLPGRRTSIVWALANDTAEAVTALDDQGFLEEVGARVGDRLGELSLEGPRYAYPLNLVWSERFTARRLALVGDAARGIHPIAGQGWNLALRDVASLAELVSEQVGLGLDPGAPHVLERYERWRRFDATTLALVTDGINRLFANDLTPVRVARSLGLSAVDRLPPLKRLFMRHATGALGDLAQTMR
ncbi:MAG: UbiH/UbiF/VisC/COQ6 family ubiquinone biosynthesis hydroxylase [Geminicoccaceae bacterium]